MSRLFPSVPHLDSGMKWKPSSIERLCEDVRDMNCRCHDGNHVDATSNSAVGRAHTSS
jgi:hypothetical protein